MKSDETMFVLHAADWGEAAIRCCVTPAIAQLVERARDEGCSVEISDDLKTSSERFGLLAVPSAWNTAPYCQEALALDQLALWFGFGDPRPKPEDDLDVPGGGCGGDTKSGRPTI